MRHTHDAQSIIDVLYVINVAHVLGGGPPHQLHGTSGTGMHAAVVPAEYNAYRFFSLVSIDNAYRGFRLPE